MKTKLLLVLVLTILAAAGTSEAGWRCGPGWGGGGYYNGPGWYGGPGLGVTIAAPLAVYRPVYVRRVVVGQPTLVRTQAQLRQLGYYRGSVDGAFGPLTSRAISQFQADNGLRITGRLDSATLRMLGS